MLASTAFATVIVSSTLVHAAEFGLVGLGRDLFEPRCCYGCLSSLWGLDLSCTDAHTKRSGGAESNLTSPLCHSTNKIYLESLAYCIKTKCAADNISSNKSEECWADVAGDGLKVDTLESYLPFSTPTVQLSYNATSLEEVSLVNEQYYQNTRRTMKEYVKQESNHSIYGTILIGTVLLFCILLQPLQMLGSFLLHKAPTRAIINFFRKYLTEPAFIGRLHLQKFPFRLGYIPSRVLTLLIIAYIGLNAALCLLNYPKFAADTWYVDSSVRDSAFMSNRIGMLSFANFALLLLFAGRNSPILGLTNASRSDVIAFHRWLGRIATIEAVIHVVLYSSITDETGKDVFTRAAGLRTINFKESYWEMGEIAAGAMAIIVIASNLPLRTRFYEIFLFIHIGLSCVALFGLWYHIVDRFTGISYGFELWLYMFFATWGLDRMLRVVRIILNNWKSLFTRSHPSSIVELLPGNEFIKITLFPSKPWKFSAGQHCFLYFPTLLTNPFQSHPFTIAAWSDNQNEATSGDVSKGFSRLKSSDIEMRDMGTLLASNNDRDSTLVALDEQRRTEPHIVFLVRPERGATAHLHKRLIRHAEKAALGKISRIPVVMEGPYGPGVHGPFKNADTIIGVAGGIGITGITSHLQVYLAMQRESKGPSTRFLLIWKVREESMISAVQSIMEDQESLTKAGVQVAILQKRDDGQRVDLGDLIKREINSVQNYGKKICVVTCAPGAMADVIRSTVVSCIGTKGPSSLELVEESFAW